MNNGHIKVFLVLALSFNIRLYAQTCGNPAGTAGRGLWTMSLSGAYQTLDHGSQTFISNRVFFKAMYGLAPWFDAYGLIGGTQVSMKNHDPALTDYRDKSRLAFGGGFNILLNPPPPRANRSARPSARSGSQAGIGFWGGANIIRYPAEAVYSLSNTPFVHEFRWKYDSREITGHAGIVIPYGNLKFYAGGIGWALQRLDTKREVATDGSSSLRDVTLKGRYQSGLWTGGMGGIQLDLPQNYSLTLEAIAFNKSYYQIMIGVSQTGVRAW
jgi:hypothetical protein